MDGCWRREPMQRLLIGSISVILNRAVAGRGRVCCWLSNIERSCAWVDVDAREGHRVARVSMSCPTLHYTTGCVFVVGSPARRRCSVLCSALTTTLPRSHWPRKCAWLEAGLGGSVPYASFVCNCCSVYGHALASVIPSWFASCADLTMAAA